MDVEYRRASESDLPAIVAFVDYWLTGGGQANGIPGATHDYFVREGQHKSYLVKYDVMLATLAGEIVGWAVKTHKGVLIHMLVAATFRGRGIDSEMLRLIRPDVVRSKYDQKSGDPAAFYEKQGYVKVQGERVGKKKNIDIFVKADVSEGVSQQNQDHELKVAENMADLSGNVCDGRKRSIDVIAEKLGLGAFSRRHD